MATQAQTEVNPLILRLKPAKDRLEMQNIAFDRASKRHKYLTS